MGFLNWINKGAQAGGKNVEVGQRPQARLHQQGESFKKGDRIVVYETWHLGRELKPDPRYSPGIVSSVQHNGTLVSYERGGRLLANAAIEDVRHATEHDLGKYEKEFCTLETKTRTTPRATPSWER
jgi:hypothetical protein